MTVAFFLVGGGVVHVLVVIQVFVVTVDVLCAIGRIARGVVRGGEEVGRVVRVGPAVCVSDGSF